MKLIIFFILISTSVYSKVSLELRVPENSVKQGQMLKATLSLKEASGQSALAGLKGQNLGQSLYIVNLTPFMGKNGQLESEAKVVFSAVPKSNSVTELINGEEIVVSWENLEVLPTEASQSFLFGDFEIPSRLNFTKWILAFLILCGLTVLSLWISSRIKSRKAASNRRQKLKLEMLDCKNYDEIVLMWRQKKRFLDEFPKLEEHFKTLEVTLFKYQFKPQRTENEMNAVEIAYTEFKNSVKGDLNGI